MAASEKVFWEYSKLPREVQGNVMQQMDRDDLKRMREVSKGSLALADVELRRRERIAMRVARKEYAARIGEMPSVLMSFEEVVAANKMRIVEALTMDDLTKALPVLRNEKKLFTELNPIGEPLLLKIPLGSVGVPDDAFKNGAYHGLAFMKIGHVHFPAGLQSVGASAFFGSHSPILDGCRLYFPDSLERIEKLAFACMNFADNPKSVCAGQTLRLPRNLKHLGNWAFSGLKMKEVIFPDYAPAKMIIDTDIPFDHCNELRHLEIPATASIDCFPEKFVGNYDELEFAALYDQFHSVETVACTNEFWLKHQSKFPKIKTHIVIPSAGGGAVAVAAAAAAASGGDDGVAGRMKRMANPNPTRPHDLATTSTTTEFTI